MWFCSFMYSYACRLLFMNACYLQTTYECCVTSLLNIVYIMLFCSLCHVCFVSYFTRFFFFLFCGKRKETELEIAFSLAFLYCMNLTGVFKKALSRSNWLRKRNSYIAENKDSTLMKLCTSMSSKTHDITQLYEENTYPLYIPRKTHKEITSSSAIISQLRKRIIVSRKNKECR